MAIPKFKEPIVYCDCDDTLVMWGAYPYHPEGEFCMEFEDPVTHGTLYLKINKKQVDQLKEHKIRGHTIIVWSAGGADWAQEVVRQCGLSGVVDAVMSKPDWFYDDIPASEFMPEDKRKHFPNG